MMSLRVNIGSSGLWLKVHLEQTCSYTFSPAVAHCSRVMFAPKPLTYLLLSACSHLLSYMLAAGSTLYNLFSTDLHKYPLHPGEAEVTPQWEQRPSGLCFRLH